MKLRAPFPWFGGKSRVAHLIWDRFGDVRNYVEPFFGSGAVLLGRPTEPGIETVNDLDGYLSNFWRAVAADPDQVAHFADWPVNEADLHARHRWLVETASERIDRVKTDPEYFDPKVAGWWVWGQCSWIGTGWCARKDHRVPSRPRDPEWAHHLGSDGRGQGLARIAAKLPALGGRDAGRGAYATSRSGKRPALTGNGVGVGVCAPGLDQKRPALQQGNGGRGVLRDNHQLPQLSGDSGAAGRGIHASGFEMRNAKLPLLAGRGCGKGVHRSSRGLQDYMRALSDRLRRVRVCCGDFERVLGPAVTTCIGVTGVFLDPPYPEEGRAICYTHDGDAVWWRAHQWAIENGDNPDLRIALCGYEHPEAEMPASWECIAWKSSGGYGRSPRGKANAHRERIWFSPGCLRGAETMPLFQGAPLREERVR